MEFSVLNGIIAKTAIKPKNLIGRTDFLHLIKQVLDRLNVQYTDICCPNSGFSPIRRNNTTNNLEYFNYATKQYVIYVP